MAGCASTNRLRLLETALLLAGLWVPSGCLTPQLLDRWEGGLATRQVEFASMQELFFLFARPENKIQLVGCGFFF